MTPDEHEEFEERAAIMEYDGGLPREEAERRARECVGNAVPGVTETPTSASETLQARVVA